MQQEKVNEKIIIESKKEVNDMNDNVIINENSLMNTPECTREEDTRKIIQDILKLPFKEWMAHYPEDYFRVVKTLAYGKPDLTDEQCSVKSFTTAEIFGYLFDRKQKIEEDHIVITDSYMESLADCTQRMVKPILSLYKTLLNSRGICRSRQAFNAVTGRQNVLFRRFQRL